MFAIYATVVFGFLFTLWKMTGVFNVVIKFALLVGAVWGLFEVMDHFGYMVKI